MRHEYKQWNKGKGKRQAFTEHLQRIAAFLPKPEPVPEPEPKPKKTPEERYKEKLAKRRERYRTDEEFRARQREAHRHFIERNPDYYKEYFKRKRNEKTNNNGD